uniref:Uncharacterized protein n=1 Tax=Parascaris equorum TaxID=6256 RepID=A0A914R7I2_PAREQ
MVEYEILLQGAPDPIRHLIKRELAAVSYCSRNERVFEKVKDL